MTWGLHFKAAGALAACLALSTPASATTFTFNLACDTTTAYSVPPVLDYKWIDLHDATSGSTAFPGITLHAGDIVQTTITLNHPMSFQILDFFLQEANGSGTTVTSDTTYTFSLGGAAVPEPTIDWVHFNSTDAGLAVGAASSTGADTLTIDKIVMNIVISSLTDTLGDNVASLDLKAGQPYVGFYKFVAPTETPVPSAFLLMSTALGGFGFMARRTRKRAP